MKQKKNLLENCYERLIDFIVRNGKKEGDSYYWEKHPVCFRDKCVDGMAVMPDAERFTVVPYNIADNQRCNPFTDSSLHAKEDLISLRTHRTINHKHLKTLLENLEFYN